MSSSALPHLHRQKSRPLAFQEINATTLLVTHQDELTSVCDRTICLSQGRVVTDTASPVVSV